MTQSALSFLLHRTSHHRNTKVASGSLYISWDTQNHIYKSFFVHCPLALPSLIDHPESVSARLGSGAYHSLILSRHLILNFDRRILFIFHHLTSRLLAPFRHKFLISLTHSVALVIGIRDVRGSSQLSDNRSE